jgi:hypothetical protein
MKVSLDRGMEPWSLIHAERILLDTEFVSMLTPRSMSLVGPMQ